MFFHFCLCLPSNLFQWWRWFSSIAIEAAVFAMALPRCVFFNYMWGMSPECLAGASHGTRTEAANPSQRPQGRRHPTGVQAKEVVL